MKKEIKKKKKEKLNYKETLINLKKAWKYSKGQRINLILFIIFSLVVCAFGVIAPILSAKIITYMTSEIWSQLIYTTLLILIMDTIWDVNVYFLDIIMKKININILTEIQFSLIEESIKISSKEMNSTSSGVFINRLDSDPDIIASAFTNATDILFKILTNIGIIISIFIINPYMCLFYIVSLIVKFTIERIRVSKAYKVRKELRKINEQNDGLISELIRGTTDIKVLNIGESFIAKTKGKIQEGNDKRIDLKNITTFYNLLRNLINEIDFVSLILFGLFLVKRNLLSPANFLVAYYYRGRITNLISHIVNFYEQLKTFNLSAERIFDITEKDTFEKEKFGTKSLGRIEGNFEFKHVNFSYDKKNKVIKDMSFKIKPNETVAFVGKSGGGKTTVFSLLNKLYEVDSGEILIEGININELDKDSIRNNMTIISQSPYIFNFSIKENLKIVKPNATMKEIKNACKVACLDEFIESLPHKYNTVVGEGGITLSGGQRQRLAIARALLKNTEIILFDEATSALDNETQSQIQEAIRNMKGEYTILIIAHRLSTVMDADRIMVVEDGKITAQGTQQELMKKSKLFKELYSKELNE